MMKQPAFPAFSFKSNLAFRSDFLLRCVLFIQCFMHGKPVSESKSVLQKIFFKR